MAQAAYCSQCGQNVYLTPDGRCPQGHGVEALTNHYQVPDAAPPAPTPKTKSKALLIVGSILGLLFLCGFVSALSSLGSANSEDSKTAATSAPTTQEAPESAAPNAQPATGPEAKKSEPAPAATMGKPFTVGNAEVTVQRIDAVTKIGNDYLNKEGEYRTLSLSMKNTSKEQFTTDSSNFKLIGSDGAEYSTDSDSLMYLDQKDSLFLESINPGVTKSGKIIFSVPASAKITAVRVMGGLLDEPVDCKVE